MKSRNSMVPSYHSKVSSIQKREFYFSFAWEMEFSIIYVFMYYICLGKVKVFPIPLTVQSQSTFNDDMKTVNELYMFLTGLILCCSTLLYQNVSFPAELGNYGSTISLASSKNWIKIISIYLIKKVFPLFQVIHCKSTRKIMLS